MDLTTLADPAVYDAFEKEMLKKKIAILFNNAGITGEKKSFWNFVNATHAGVCREVSINAEVVALMTKMILPGSFTVQLYSCYIL
jgi:short-subunit dehydrogenase